MAIASAVAWIFAAVVHIFLFLDHNLFVSIQVLLEAAFLVLLIFCSVIVYREIRRHELQIALIAAQQVSPEARERFLKEKTCAKINDCYCCNINSKLLTHRKF